jgi:hypothetical protein
MFTFSRNLLYELKKTVLRIFYMAFETKFYARITKLPYG